MCEEDQLFKLHEELAALALKDFGEIKERRSAALLELRARIEALPESDRLSDTSEANIIRFIRARAWNLQILSKNPDASIDRKG